MGYNVSLLVDVRFYPEKPFLKVIEAEDGAVAGAMERVDDTSASGGAHVQLALPGTSVGGEGTVTFNFEVPRRTRIMYLGAVWRRSHPAGTTRSSSRWKERSSSNGKFARPGLTPSRGPC